MHVRRMQLFVRDDVRGMIDAMAAERDLSVSDLVTQIVREERARNPPPPEKPVDVPPSPLASFPVRILAFLDRDGPCSGPILAWRLAAPLDRVYTALAKHAGDGNVKMKRAKKGEVVFELTPQGLAIVEHRRS